MGFFDTVGQDLQSPGALAANVFTLGQYSAMNGLSGGAIGQGAAGVETGIRKGLSGLGKGAHGAQANINPYARINPALQVQSPGAGPANGASAVSPAAMLAAQSTTPQGPTAGQVNMTGDPFAAGQQNLANTLALQASGQGPSIAENQLRAGQEGNIAAQFALANSARGGANPALARQALTNEAQINGGLSQQAATARLQEQQAAAGTLNNVLSAGRGQNLEGGIANAQLTQGANLAGYQGQLQTGLANAQLQQQAAGTNYGGNLAVAQQNAQLAQAHNQLLQQYAAMGMDAQKANQAADLQVQQMGQNQTTNQNQLAMEQAKANNAHSGNMLQGLGGLAMGVGAFFGGPAGAAAGSAVGSELEQSGNESGDEMPTIDGPMPEGRAHGGYITPSHVAYALACGGHVPGGYAPMQTGGPVPGTPIVQGDSAKNDFVHALLSPGEIVIPRSHSGSPEAAAEFVRSLHGSLKKAA